MTTLAKGRLLSSVGALVVVAVVVVGLRVVTPTPQLLVTAVAAVGFLAVLVLAPVHTLPSISLAAFVFVPQQAVGYLNGASPAAIALGVWAVRRIVTGGAARGDSLLLWARIAAVAAAAWGCWLLTQSTDAVAFQLGAQWMASLILAVVLPLLAGGAERELQTLWRVWPVVTIVAALYIGIEYALGSNPLYGRIYDIVGRSVTQDWAVYRAHGSFGHPLYAATFFAASVAAALARFVTVPRAPWLWGVAAAAALTLTVSRSALAAAAVAAVLIFVLVPIFARGRVLPRYGGAVAVAGVGALVIAASGLLQSRVDSSEASTSSAARGTITDITFTAIRASDWLGVGPGMADRALAPWNDQQYVVESSPLQILLSLGLPGAIALGLITVLAAVAALTRKNIPILAALIALVIAISGYNAIEALLPLHALLGLLFLMAFARTADAT
ncbi:O-antigen ligase family protein [Microbacterium sp. SLBN-146]|uniref:O-antigen ligase family protein n=1 Tax=Microbacterium sp. SLBN-146 TaxID=2768457 RepID=UPI00114F1711|nr:O-antigen ligase family protein [Microbacterium sp. SLBN-146]TQJ29572.1 O-antigen ligase-like membrane protein [Microbacterium sp. SLBN-146]